MLPQEYLLLGEDQVADPPPLGYSFKKAQHLDSKVTRLKESKTV